MTDGDADAHPSGRTNLRRLRDQRGMSREQVAAAAGLSLSTYRRLEVGETPNPPIRYLVNLAIVFDCTLAEVVEDVHVQWLATEVAARPPLQPRALWARGRKRSEIPPGPPGIWGAHPARRPV